MHFSDVPKINIVQVVFLRGAIFPIYYHLQRLKSQTEWLNHVFPMFDCFCENKIHKIKI